MVEQAINHGHHQGLTEAEAQKRLAKYGLNQLPKEKGISPLTILLNQFKSPLVYIILTAALVSLLVREMGDFFIIMAVVVIDAILGFLQEYQAQRTYEALKGLIKETATIIRGGERQEIDSSQLVPGDLVLLTNGERIPADGILVEGIKLSVDEAILTGESEPVMKAETPDSEKLFMGTTIAAGRGLMQVTLTGAETELGKIAKSVQEHQETDTPLQARLKAFSKTLTRVVVLFTAGILIAGLFMGHPFLHMLRTSIILAIAAVPEGLLIAVTVILVLGMRKILARNALVKNLLAVETLGSVSVICTDKTGTLTEGRMRVSRSEFSFPDEALETTIFCNNLEGPVDIALWDFAKSSINDDPQAKVDETERLSEELFSSETKFMATAVKMSDGSKRDYLKGAPEIVLGMCTMPDNERSQLQIKIDGWAGEGLRLLGLAFRPHDDLAHHAGYTWAGLLGMEDPIRPEVLEAVRTTQRAGIRVKMITGDYRLTAERIARNIGLLAEGEEILEGRDLEAMDDQEFRERIQNVAVFARIRPQDKLRIIKALQARHEITAMIGDGVNDAPALKRANIGVVVGSATDVAKETADLILMDNNFRTIVAAVEEGRVIFENIRKVVAYTLSNSFAEVLTIFTAMMLRWPAPLSVAQILWIHLICDGPSDIVLGFEPKENGIMDEKPKSIREPILPRLNFLLIGIISAASAIAALLLFGHYYTRHLDAVEGQSIVFASFAVNSMIYIFAYRSLRQPLHRMPLLSQNKPLAFSVMGGLGLVVIAFAIPGLRKLLGIVPLHPVQWAVVAAIAFGLLFIVELAKAISHKIQQG